MPHPRKSTPARRVVGRTVGKMTTVSLKSTESEVVDKDVSCAATNTCCLESMRVRLCVMPRMIASEYEGINNIWDKDARLITAARMLC